MQIDFTSTSPIRLTINQITHLFSEATNTGKCINIICSFADPEQPMYVLFFFFASAYSVFIDELANVLCLMSHQQLNYNVDNTNKFIPRNNLVAGLRCV